VFALAWGINEGLLSEDEYLPVVKRGWEALVGAVDFNGKLGWSQSPSIDPTPVRAGRSEPYAVGAFLLAGAEIHRLVSRRDVPR
jgi:rhamnogalacturonyl hydrolase YesR